MDDQSALFVGLLNGEVLLLRDEGDPDLLVVLCLEKRGCAHRRLIWAVANVELLARGLTNCVVALCLRPQSCKHVGRLPSFASPNFFDNVDLVVEED